LGFAAYTFGYVIEAIFDKLSLYPYAAPLFLLFLAGIIWLYLSKFSKNNVSMEFFFYSFKEFHYLFLSVVIIFIFNILL
ncbi:hypothetical protein OLV99_04090, partial [Campylobacter jejuni]|nr:hypothetical protein [Campylobacter jejuni]